MTPEEYSYKLYWKFSEMDNLSPKEVIECCNFVLEELVNNSDAVKKWYWLEVKAFINKRVIV